MSLNIDPASTIQSRSGIVTSAGDVLAANDKRRTLIIQNLGTSPLFVALGTGASASVFDFILQAGTGTDDGSGGVFLEDTLSYTGIISVYGASVRCTVTEI